MNDGRQLWRQRPLAQKLLVACLDILETWRGDQLKDFGSLFVDAPYSEAKNLGVNLVALGNDKVPSTAGAGMLN